MEENLEISNLSTFYLFVTVLTARWLFLNTVLVTVQEDKEPLLTFVTVLRNWKYDYYDYYLTFY